MNGDQLDLDAAREARDQAVQRVDDNADAAWKDLAYRAVRFVALSHERFTSDAIWAALDSHPEHVPPREPRALGPVILRAVRDGLIRYASCEHCGTSKVTTAGRRAHGNATDVPVYESLIYGQRASA